MSTLIVVEHDNSVMHPATRHVLTAACQLQQQPILLVVGHQCHAVAEEAALLAGVEAVWYADHEAYTHHLAENVSKLIADIAPSFQYILAASSTFAKDLLPRCAALLDVAQVSDVTHILAEDTFSHPIYAGNAIETVKLLDPIKVLSIRVTAFNPVTEKQAACVIETLNPIFSSEQTQFVSRQLNQSVRPDLQQAKIIVSGGRGLQNAENFKLIEELADCLGAAVGASRAAVDAGFVTNDFQVGQTGKIVAPDLYIAIGISGAIQHIAGMKDAKVIVAINKDAEAPIFQIANYGLVGDLFELVPALIKQLKQG